MIRVNLLAPAGAPAGRRISVPPRHRGAALGILMMLVTGAGVFGWVWQNNRQGTALDAPDLGRAGQACSAARRSDACGACGRPHV